MPSTELTTLKEFLDTATDAGILEFSQALSDDFTDGFFHIDSASEAGLPTPEKEWSMEQIRAFLPFKWALIKGILDGQWQHLHRHKLQPNELTYCQELVPYLVVNKYAIAQVVAHLGVETCRPFLGEDPKRWFKILADKTQTVTSVTAVLDTLSKPLARQILLLFQKNQPNAHAQLTEKVAKTTRFDHGVPVEMKKASSTPDSPEELVNQLLDLSKPAKKPVQAIRDWLAIDTPESSALKALLSRQVLAHFEGKIWLDSAPEFELCLRVWTVIPKPDAFTQDMWDRIMDLLMTRVLAYEDDQSAWTLLKQLPLPVLEHAIAQIKAKSHTSDRTLRSRLLNWHEKFQATFGIMNT